MNINKKLLPLKLHFFLFWASISSALPFMMVIARQLGVPVGIQGTISAVVITGSVLAKPVISAAADYLPGFRKAIFLALLTIMVTTIGPIGFLPPMYTLPMYSGQLLKREFSDRDLSNMSKFYFLGESSDSCQLTSGWDCKAACNKPDICPIGNNTLESIKVFFLGNGVNSFSTSEKLDSLHSTFSSIIRNGSNISSNQSVIYRLEGLPVSFTEADFDIRILCAGGERSGDDCVPPWYTLEFWIYITLLLAGQISATTAESISDAICLDTIGENGDYGSQRAWGALSYGILGTFSGFLVDWKSGSNIVKDYTPAFLLLVVFGTLDVLLSAGYLKVPKFEGGTAVWENLRPLLRQTHFFLFLCIAFLVGFFDGVDTGYVFMKEDMAAGTSTMDHMKLLQGLTMLVQALSAAPFMFIYDWFMKKMGSQKVIALVLLLYSIRLLGLALAGYLKLVWATIVIELINGPCFGLGYTAIIMQASSITPPGTSATIQSVVNISYGTLGYAGASLIGGILYEAVGGVWLYIATGILAAITCLLHVALLKFQSTTPENEEDHFSTEERSNIRKTDEDEYEMTNMALIEKCTTTSKEEMHSLHGKSTSGERQEQHELTETTMIKGEIT